MHPAPGTDGHGATELITLEFLQSCQCSDVAHTLHANIPNVISAMYIRACPKNWIFQF